MMKGKHIVLGISGGIAAYKSAALLRLFVKRGAEVQVVITPNGKEFITPVTLSALSGKPVVSEFFTANTGEWHSHVDLGLWADLMVIAPATASTIAKMANGVADNMLITTYLSAKEHVMVAPAMDLDMWAHPSTQRNIATLKADGVEIIEPGAGELASHLVGKGRMEEPEEICRRVEEYLKMQDATSAHDVMAGMDIDSGNASMSGLKVGITAGPTYEKIDPVRYIGNYSSGKMGFALAEECARRGADVTLITGPVSLGISNSAIDRVDVESAREMCDAACQRFNDMDICIFAAAVADYRPELELDSKLKREKTGDFCIKLVKNPDIAAKCGESKRKDQTFVGFALETDHESDNAVDKLKRKNLDLIVMNSLNDKGAGFGTDTNKVTLFSAEGAKSFPLKSKAEVAADIIDTILERRKR
jgi:phosphopantothenoylcysteine decarboxylase/phosphopantothenate--cysteine ligase